eukprot:sb/3476748/
MAELCTHSKHFCGISRKSIFERADVCFSRLRSLRRVKQPIRTRYLGHVTGYQPIRDQYFLIRFLYQTYLISCRYQWHRCDLVPPRHGYSFAVGRRGVGNRVGVGRGEGGGGWVG